MSVSDALSTFKRLKGNDCTMKKLYSKPEIEVIEYVAEDVLMVSLNTQDNDISWLDTNWSASLSDIL